MSETAAIRFVDVSKAFGSLKVLDRVSFEIPRGSAFCILGRSGTGKSVMLRQLVGLIKPDSGQIFVEDDEITHLSSRELSQVRKRMGFLFQYSALFDSISVGENVAFPLRRHTRLSSAEIRERATALLDRVGLPGIYDKGPADISGGMRKRAGLARALALNPSILLVDEPSSGLDPVTSGEIDELLHDLKVSEGATLVVVTHNIPSARRIGDTLAVLHEGHILDSGTAEDLDNSKHQLVQDFMKAEGAN
ncbi:MAG: ATP-binding cassette domain-containing protein [Bryobacterales bacterium]|jgi:phospholipid/cholesterol/gamma-HCH transport system ATP-binding protein|nr:ATP-binding cassette domain-containing protein [Bryobacterales bacterium]